MEKKITDCRDCPFWEVTTDFINRCKHGVGQYLPGTEKGIIATPRWCPILKNDPPKESVYVRHECIFHYCPNPEGCKASNKCHSPQ